ncbi:carboxypeptidase regulatory-like domain-containing protein [Haliangium ochraceum]|uniref:Putative lipoprotein n=1 Tax=Haliangium ochraceum (strain DSM 14365 / JCM 11303 / SMP-2) TaxID=502025 RepID=D0LVI5_HALO1|nr:carboxypeptidase regulatory-like domain-containing protein [Haliangium ochraceum]ACY17546.1 putative lipoprotein [Haliangium ochraceum DSM 14365]
MHASLRLSLAFAAALALLASPSLGSASPGKRGKAPAAKATGTIVGHVLYRGTPPPRPPLARDTDPVCAKTAMRSERVVVTDGKLRDALVRLPAGSAGTHAVPSEAVVVDQLACMYRPRVVGVMAGQSLVVRNSDPTYHNVRGTKHEHTEWNLGQPPKGPVITRERLGEPGEVVTLRCDVHPWMRGYAVVSDHPFFDVSGDDGSFRLENVPVGRYTVEAWHPELGLKKAELTVRAGAEARVDIAFP